MNIAWTLSLVALLLGLPAISDADGTQRCSGAVVSIDPAAGTLVVAEVGPWQAKEGKAVTTTRSIELTPATRYERVDRSDRAPSGFKGDFVPSPISGSDVAAGDQVTVECEQRGARLIAGKITVIKLDR
jgi:hypothetical protein